VNLKAHTREIVLGAILIVVLFLLFRPSAPEPRLALDEPATEKKDDPMDVLRRIGNPDFTRLTDPGESYDGGGRNLFDYGVIKPPPPSPEEVARMQAEAARRQQQEEKAREEAEQLRREAAARQEEEARRAAQERAQQLAENPPPPPPPAVPVCDLKLFGLVGEPGRKRAIFLDGDKYLTAREGEIVKQQFKVEKIGYDSLRLGYTDPRFASEHVTLSLGSSS
jgi:type IV secretory pathway VirB10-like protein